MILVLVVYRFAVNSVRKKCQGARTSQSQQNRQNDETMKCSQYHQAEVHTEIVHLDQPTLREEKNCHYY